MYKKFPKNLYICIYTHLYENSIFCIYSVYKHDIYTLFVYIIYTYRHPRLYIKGKRHKNIATGSKSMMYSEVGPSVTIV